MELKMPTDNALTPAKKETRGRKRKHPLGTWCCDRCRVLTEIGQRRCNTCKEKLKIYMRIYRENNREKINKLKRESYYREKKALGIP
jgi:hypothetical protein